MSQEAAAADDPALWPDEARALWDAARAAESSDSRPRKHHLVPRSYLKRWEDGGKLRVTEIDSGRSYLTSAGKAARETDFYRFETEDIDPAVVPPLLVEIILGAIEGPAVQAIDDLLLSRGRRPAPGPAAVLARFLGYQHTRGSDFRAQMRAMVHESHVLQYGEMNEADIRRMLEERTAGVHVNEAAVQEALSVIEDMKSGRLKVQPQDAWTIGMALQHADLVGWLLLAREWHIIETPNALVTCDEPLVEIGGPGHQRDERSGITNAGVVVFPLAPDALLAMFRKDIAPTAPEVALDHLELADINREILSHSARWGFERPSRRATVGLKVPPAGEPIKVDNAIGLLNGPPGTEVVRIFRPTRWVVEPGRPWPVARWWAWSSGSTNDSRRAQAAGRAAIDEARNAWVAQGAEWPLDERE